MDQPIPFHNKQEKKLRTKDKDGLPLIPHTNTMLVGQHQSSELLNVERMLKRIERGLCLVARASLAVPFSDLVRKNCYFEDPQT
jgi:hypothetical protein